MVEAQNVGGVGGLTNLNGKIELVDDSIALNEEFKKNVAIPYFKDIYKDLVQWSDNKNKGINKVSILTVITYLSSLPYL
jgi:hypothetical protein